MTKWPFVWIIRSKTWSYGVVVGAKAVLITWFCWLWVFILSLLFFLLFYDEKERVKEIACEDQTLLQQDRYPPNWRKDEQIWVSKVLSFFLTCYQTKGQPSSRTRMAFPHLKEKSILSWRHKGKKGWSPCLLLICWDQCHSCYFIQTVPFWWGCSNWTRRTQHMYNLTQPTILLVQVQFHNMIQVL